MKHVKHSFPAEVPAFRKRFCYIAREFEGVAAFLTSLYWHKGFQVT